MTTMTDDKKLPDVSCSECHRHALRIHLGRLYCEHCYYDLIEEERERREAREDGR